MDYKQHIKYLLKNNKETILKTNPNKSAITLVDILESLLILKLDVSTAEVALTAVTPAFSPSLGTTSTLSETSVDIFSSGNLFSGCTEIFCSNCSKSTLL